MYVPKHKHTHSQTYTQILKYSYKQMKHVHKLSNTPDRPHTHTHTHRHTHTNTHTDRHTQTHTQTHSIQTQTRTYTQFVINYVIMSVSKITRLKDGVLYSHLFSACFFFIVLCIIHSLQNAITLIWLIISPKERWSLLYWHANGNSNSFSQNLMMSVNE